MPTSRLLWLALAGALASAPSSAEVVDAAAHGFTVSREETIAAPAERVWPALTAEIGRWWHSDHSFSGDASNLSIVLGPDGCFCERLPSGGAVRHLSVVHYDPGKLLRMTGGLGPLQALAIAGSFEIRLTAAGAGTTVTWTYAVGGYAAGGLESWAAPVDGVLALQLGRLAAWVESGSPEG